MLKHKLLIALVLLVVIASACAPAPTATPVPPTAAPKPAATVMPTAVPPTAVPPTAAPKPTEAPKPTAAVAATSAPSTSAGKALAEKFNNPDQTMEYHFMLNVPNLVEKDRDKIIQTSVVEPLKALGDIGALGKAKSGVYVDSKDYALDKNNLIVRVRDGQITTKARAASPDVLLDLADCGARKYEMDYFGEPNYSISSDILFKSDEFVTVPPTLTIPSLWGFMEKKCPALYKQIEPSVKNAAIEIPGVATMYSAEIKLKHPAAAKAKESSLAVWFFPPTDKSLVEFAYTGYVKDKADMEKLYVEAKTIVKSAGLYKEEQISKTSQYFINYFGVKK